MNDRVKSSAEHVKKLLMEAVLPRNQISTISGVSNTYIRDLEKGNIAKVSRKKLIGLAVALNLRLSAIDDLLVAFGLTALSPKDVDLFIERFDLRKFTTAIIPIRDFFAYELMTNSMKQAPGEQIIVNDRPTICVRPRGHRSYSDTNLVKSHPMYGVLVEAIGKMREQTLANNLFHFKEHHYICKQCLEDYLLKVSDAVEQKFRAQHIRNKLNYIRTFTNLEVHLTSMCSSHLFVLKYPAIPENSDVSLCFTARPGHGATSGRAGRLSGFATINPVMVKTFEEELKSIKSSVIKKYSDQRALEKYLQDLVAPFL